MATSTAAPISLVSQANDVLYSLLEKTKFEHMKLPVDINLLTFTKKGLDVKYRELLFCDGLNKANYSQDLLSNLILFYFLLTSYYVLTLIVVLVYYFHSEISLNQALLHLMPFTALIVLYYAALYLTRVRRSFLLNIRSLICSLNVLLIVYFAIVDKNLTSRIFDEDQTKLFASHMTVIMLFLYLSLIVTMHHFLSMVIISVATVAALLAVKVGSRVYRPLAILEEVALVAAFCTLLCFLGYQREYRSREIFYQLQREEEAHSELRKITPANNVEGGFKTEVEKAADLCDTIRKIVKEATAVIIYKDVRAQLKSVISKVEELRNKIVRNMFVEDMELEMTEVDADNEKYIRQHYLDKPIISRKTTLLAKKTLIDIPLSAGLPDYGEDDLNAELQGIGRTWNFDIWMAYEKVGKSVFLVGNYLMVKWELSLHYDLDEAVMNACFQKIEMGYRDNPYHNACHAADVCHSLMYFVNHSDLIKNMSGLDLLASMFASLGHDINHPGVTNRYLVLTQHELAITYNDNSVLENMHASRLFQILGAADSNVLEDVPADDAMIIRKLIIEMILETDMSKHFASVGRFRSISKRPGINYSKQEDKFFCLAFALKCADVAHSAKVIDVHIKWSERVLAEFFQQGDMERDRGLEISMYCDRHTTDVPKSQVAFLSVICKPMFETWTDFLKSDEIIFNCRSQIEKNLEYWENRARGQRSITPDKAKPAKMLRFFTMAEKKKTDEM